MDANAVFLASQSEKYTLFPITYETLYSCYKRHQNTYWTTEELDLYSDQDDWITKLNDNERFWIKHALAFFAGSDGIVSGNLMERFMAEVSFPEMRAFYAMQNLIETVHNETYSTMIDNYISDPDEKMRLFQGIQTMPAVRRKAEWIVKHMNSDAPIAERLLAFIQVEGIFFAGSFASIFWLRHRGLMRGLAAANELIMRDENLHVEAAIELWKLLPEKLPVERVHAIVREAVEIEHGFVEESLPVALLGIDAEVMQRYIEYVADDWLAALDYPPIYGLSRCPLDYMRTIGVMNKANFFETRVTDYPRGASVSLHRELIVDTDF